MQGYCMKCRAKKEMKNAKAITMKNGRPATQGVCPVCGTKMFKIGKAQQFTKDGKKNTGGWTHHQDLSGLGVYKGWTAH